MAKVKNKNSKANYKISFKIICTNGKKQLIYKKQS